MKSYSSFIFFCLFFFSIVLLFFPTRNIVSSFDALDSETVFFPPQFFFCSFSVDKMAFFKKWYLSKSVFSLDAFGHRWFFPSQYVGTKETLKKKN